MKAKAEADELDGGGRDDDRVARVGGGRGGDPREPEHGEREDSAGDKELSANRETP